MERPLDLLAKAITTFGGEEATTETAKAIAGFKGDIRSFMRVFGRSTQGRVHFTSLTQDEFSEYDEGRNLEKKSK